MDVVTLLFFLVGLLLLVGGAEVLVRGAAALATDLGISPLVVGLTVVAFATSAPELAVCLQSAWNGEPDIAIGNVVGSNIANVLLILGVSAVTAPLIVAQKIVRLDVPLMIAASIVVILMSLDGTIGWIDGAVLGIALVVYVVWTLRASRRETRAVRAEYAQEYGAKGKGGGFVKNALFVVGGLALLVIGAGWLVDGASAFAVWLGASPLIVGLTIVAIGTSLPELATSIVAGLRGQRDIAVGNAIGSNILNLLLVLGVTGMLSPGGVPVAHAALAFDLPVMTAVAFACLPIFARGHRLERWEGAVFLGYYAAYLTYLVLQATQSVVLGQFRVVMLAFVIPLTVVTIVALLVRNRRGGEAT